MLQKQRSLAQRIVEGHVRMGDFVEPVFWHISLGGVAVAVAEQGHRIGLDVQSGMRKRAFAGKAQ